MCSGLIDNRKNIIRSLIIQGNGAERNWGANVPLREVEGGRSRSLSSSEKFWGGSRAKISTRLSQHDF